LKALVIFSRCCVYEIEKYSAKKLNSEKVYEQFLNRKELEEGSN